MKRAIKLSEINLRGCILQQLHNEIFLSPRVIYRYNLALNYMRTGSEFLIAHSRPPRRGFISKSSEDENSNCRNSNTSVKSCDVFLCLQVSETQVRILRSSCLGLFGFLIMRKHRKQLKPQQQGWYVCIIILIIIYAPTINF